MNLFLFCSVGLCATQLPLWWLFLFCSLYTLFVKSRISSYICSFYSLIFYLQAPGQLSAFRLGCCQLTLEDMVLSMSADTTIIITLNFLLVPLMCFFIYPVSYLCPTQVTLTNLTAVSV